MANSSYYEQLIPQTAFRKPKNSTSSTQKIDLTLNPLSIQDEKLKNELKKRIAQFDEQIAQTLLPDHEKVVTERLNRLAYIYKKLGIE